MLKITWNGLYIDCFEWISCHICWFSSFSVLAKTRYAVYRLFRVDFVSYLLIFEFQCFGENTICWKSREIGYISTISGRFRVIFDDFWVSVFWQKHKLLCRIWYTFCDKTIWDYLKNFEVLRNPRFFSKHNLPEIVWWSLIFTEFLQIRVIFADFEFRCFGKSTSCSAGSGVSSVTKQSEII